jgi:hypothetical protein
VVENNGDSARVGMKMERLAFLPKSAMRNGVPELAAQRGQFFEISLRLFVAKNQKIR